MSSPDGPASAAASPRAETATATRRGFLMASLAARCDGLSGVRGGRWLLELRSCVAAHHRRDEPPGPRPGDVVHVVAPGSSRATSGSRSGWPGASAISWPTASASTVGQVGSRRSAPGPMKTRASPGWIPDEGTEEPASRLAHGCGLDRWTCGYRSRQAIGDWARPVHAAHRAGLGGLPRSSGGGRRGRGRGHGCGARRFSRGSRARRVRPASQCQCGAACPSCQPARRCGPCPGAQAGVSPATCARSCFSHRIKRA